MSDLFGHIPVRTLPLDGEAGQKARGAFYTPDQLALGICRTLWSEGARPDKVFEPGCGGGAFLRAARTVWPMAELLGVDLLPACDGPGLVFQKDLFEVVGLFDLVLGNPDYAIAERVVRHSLAVVRPWGLVAMLLRAAFLGSGERVPLYREHPLRFLQPIAQRPSFTGGGSDPMEYALFVWQRDFRGRGEVLAPMVWR